MERNPPRLIFAFAKKNTIISCPTRTILVELLRSPLIFSRSPFFRSPENPRSPENCSDVTLQRTAAAAPLRRFEGRISSFETSERSLSVPDDYYYTLLIRGPDSLKFYANVLGD